MKKMIVLIFVIFNSSIFAQNCNIGNSETTGFDATGYFTENYLLGVKFYLNNSGVLTSLNLVGKNTHCKVQLAMYADNAGVPGNLVASTNIATVGLGHISLPVNPTQVLAGNYWIMGIYDSTETHTFKKNVATNTVFYKALTFGSSIPQNASNFSSYTGSDFTYYAQITCGTVGLPDDNNLSITNFSDLNIYPNPANDVLTINLNHHLIGSSYTITNLLGMQVLKGILQENTSFIEIGQLEKGVYQLTLGQQNNQTFKLIKN